MTDRTEREKWEAAVDEWTPILEREAASVHAETSACRLERLERERDQAQQNAVNVLNEVHGSWWKRLMRKIFYSS